MKMYQQFFICLFKQFLHVFFLIITCISTTSYASESDILIPKNDRSLYRYNGGKKQLPPLLEEDESVLLENEESLADNQVGPSYEKDLRADFFEIIFDTTIPRSDQTSPELIIIEDSDENKEKSDKKIKKACCSIL